MFFAFFILFLFVCYPVIIFTKKAPRSTWNLAHAAQADGYSLPGGESSP